MRKRPALLVVVHCALLGTAFASIAGEDKTALDDAVARGREIARINGTAIRLHELSYDPEQRYKVELHAMEVRLYRDQKAVLRQYIDQKLLEQEAAKRNMNADELIAMVTAQAEEKSITFESDKEVLFQDFVKKMQHDFPSFSKRTAVVQSPGAAGLLSLPAGSAGTPFIEAVKNKVVEMKTRSDLGLFAKLQENADPRRREEIYLTHCILDETYARWEKYYLPLAGTMRFEPSMRLTDRSDKGLSTAGVALTDLRQAIHEHQKTRFVILGEPGCGKTTTLLRLALDLAREPLCNPLQAKLPMRADLYKYTGDEQPDDFLRKEWEKTGLSVGYGEAVSSQQVCFLLDGVNQMPMADRATLLRLGHHPCPLNPVMKRNSPNGKVAMSSWYSLPASDPPFDLPRKVKLRIAHALHAACHNDLRMARLDDHGRMTDRIQSGATAPVQGDSWNRFRPPCL